MNLYRYHKTIICVLYWLFSTVQSHIMFIRLMMHKQNATLADLWQYDFFLTTEHTECVYMTFCSLLDTMRLSGIETLILAVILVLISKLAINWRTAIVVIYALGMGYMNNEAIFVDRIASWSTYTRAEVFHYTLEYSSFSLLLCWIIFTVVYFFTVTGRR